MTSNLVGIFLVIIGTGLGLFYSALSIDYIIKYVTFTGPSGKSELIMGMALPLIFSSPSWLVSSLGVFLIRKKVSFWIQCLIYSFAVITTTSLLYFLLID